MHINARHEARRQARREGALMTYRAAVLREQGRRIGQAEDDSQYGFEALTKPFPAATATRRTVTHGSVIGTETRRDGPVVVFSRNVLVPMYVVPLPTSKYRPNEEQARGKR
jgi:hypothetical protein